MPVDIPEGSGSDRPTVGNSRIVRVGGQLMDQEYAGLPQPIGGFGWQHRMSAFITSQLQVLNSPDYFSDLLDQLTAAEQDWVTVTGTPQSGGGYGGSLILGSTTGLNSIRLKAGSAAAPVPSMRGTPWAIVSRAAPRAIAATVAHAMACAIGVAGTRACFGYKGAISQTNYAIWVEDNSGNVLSQIPVTTNIPVLLSGTPNQTFMILFDGTTMACFYASDVNSTLVLAGETQDIADMPFSSGMTPGALNRTGAATTESCIVAAILGKTMVPQ